MYVPPTESRRIDLIGTVHGGALITKAQESTPHIHLKTLEVSDIFQFVLQLSEYETTNGVRPSAAPTVSHFVQQRVDHSVCATQ